VYSTTNYFSFEIIYDFNFFTSLDWFHSPIDERVSFDDNRKTKILKALWKVEQQIQKQNEQCAFKAKKSEGGLFFVHMQKERFS